MTASAFLTKLAENKIEENHFWVYFFSEISFGVTYIQKISNFRLLEIMFLSLTTKLVCQIIETAKCFQAKPWNKKYFYSSVWHLYNKYVYIVVTNNLHGMFSTQPSQQKFLLFTCDW